MEVISVRPFGTASLLWQPRKNAFALTVICKASFLLRPTESPITEDTEPPNEDDNHWDDDPSRSVYSPSDLVPFKRRADVLLVGNAFAPRNEPVQSLVVRLIVGEVDKSIEVFGDRAFAQDGTLRHGPRFAKMPLRYERAAGGPETANPVGIWMNGPPDRYGYRAVPNLQPPGLFISRWNDVIPSIGFGPIAATWPDRRGKLRRYAGVWPPARSHWADQPFLEDVDTGFFNAAPYDQQLDELRDDERIVLENLLPDQPRLITSLPGVRPCARVERRSGTESLAMRADTLWIDTDRSLCTVTWRAQLWLEHSAEPGRVVITAEQTMHPMMRHPGQAQGGNDRVQTQAAVLQRAPVMPFVAAPLGQSPIAHISLSRNAGDARSAAARGGDIEEISSENLNEADENAGSIITGSPIITLAISHDDGRAQVPAEPERREEGAETLFLPHRAAKSKPALPFTAPGHTTSPVSSAAPISTPAPIASPAAPHSSGSTPKPVAPPAMVYAPVTTDPIAPAMKPSVWAGGAGAASAGSAAEEAIVAPELMTPAGAVPSAAASGVLAASNAAAARPLKTPETEETGKKSPAVAAAEARAKPHEIVKLLWFDPKSLARIRKHEQWRITLAELELRLLDQGDDDEEASQEEGNSKDRREVFEVLTRAQPTGPEGIKRVFAQAMREDGKFEPPLVLVAGELEFPFDEIETLKATVTAVTPLAAGDKKLKEVLETVAELLKTPWLQGSGGIAEGLTEKVKEAFAQGKRVLPPDYLESHTERMLLQERCHQKRTVYGKRWIRSVLRASGAGGELPVYVPEALKDELPIFRRVRVKMLAEVDMREDQYETSACALKVVALGRVVPPVA